MSIFINSEVNFLIDRYSEIRVSINHFNYHFMIIYYMENLFNIHDLFIEKNIDILYVFVSTNKVNNLSCPIYKSFEKNVYFSIEQGIFYKTDI